MSKRLDTYHAKRDFSKTPEPSGDTGAPTGGHVYVIQKHAARRLHYDFRLELDGVLKSWAVPEGPSLVPTTKRLAVHVEDHPLEYGNFEGVIPRGEYGAGTVMIWDRGSWTPEIDPEFGYRKGHLKFRLHGRKLGGAWHLVRMAPKPREKQEAWLLFKSDDAAARAPDTPDVLEEMPCSVVSGRTLDEIARQRDRIWSSRAGGEVTQRKAPVDPPVIDPSVLAKAEAGPLPAFVEPCLPSPVEKAPRGADWVHEIKHDGYRVQLRVEDGVVRLLTRTGLDWTERFTRLTEACARLPVRSVLLDGEIVVEADSGVASFTALVDALRTGRGDFVFYLFDLLYLDGFDLRETPLAERKAALANLLVGCDRNSRLRYSEHLEGDGETIFRHAGRLGIEGIVSKRRSSPYRSGRVSSWTKLKWVNRASFVIAGFVPSSVAKKAIGALVMAEHVDGKLTPSGHVGSGFSASQSSQLWQKLDPLRTRTPPIADETAVAKGAKWVDPVLVAEIEYRSRTGTGIIRHATFRELAEGVDPAKVVRDAPTPREATPQAAPPARLTNPGRLLWPDEGVTKQGLAEFYVGVADWILPHIVGRPLSLVRYPEGVQHQGFFQKHKWSGLGDAVRLVPILDEAEPGLAIDDLNGLIELVQASVLEIHPWGSQADRPDLPDRATLDLDPGDDVPWERVVAAACEVRSRLADLGLESFVKTSGGKGLHVVFPIEPQADWDTLKHFTRTIAERMAADTPDRYTANMAKCERGGRIYVDYVRNGMGATAVAAYSTRARPGAAVSTPLAWEELGPAIRANHFTIENLPLRFAALARDPWEDIARLRQRLPEVGGGAKRKTAPRKTVRPRPSLAPGSIEYLSHAAPVPSKDSLAAYWKKVAKRALVYLRNRPLKLLAQPESSDLGKRVPVAVRYVRVETDAEMKGEWPWIENLDGLLGLLELGAVELHPWRATVDSIEQPDSLGFVLKSDGRAGWRSVTETALRLRDALRSESLDCWPKLSGGTGIDVVVPIEPELDWDEARRFCDSLARRVEAASAKVYVTGRTEIGAYSPRALPGFPVAAPLAWTDLEQATHKGPFTLSKPPTR